MSRISVKSETFQTTLVSSRSQLAIYRPQIKRQFAEDLPAQSFFQYFDRKKKQYNRWITIVLNYSDGIPPVVLPVVLRSKY